MTLLDPIDTSTCGCDLATTESKGLIGFDQATELIAHHTLPIQGRDLLHPDTACGRVLAAPVHAARAAPPFDMSAMDGFAIRTSDLVGHGPWTLRIGDRIAAGERVQGGLAPGTAARIFTGAPIPVGADAVVMQEHCSQVEGHARIDHGVTPGTNIRILGEDMAAGARVLSPGTMLGPRQVAASAAAGARRIEVRRKLRVGLLVTGNEVHTPTGAVPGASIHDVNTPMMLAALSRPDVTVVQVATTRDDLAETSRILRDLSDDCDLVVTTGGVSVGEEDHVLPAMKQTGEILFSGVAIKPGKPVSFGRVGGAMWLGLPGNPMSAYITWQLFGRLTLSRLLGLSSAHAPRHHVVTGKAIRRKPGRCEFRPATRVGIDRHGRDVVDFEDATHSAKVTQLATAEGVLMIPGDTDFLPEGGLLEFLPFHDQQGLSP